MYQAYQIYYLYRKYWVSQIYQLYQIHLTYHRWKTEIYHDDDQSCAPIEDVVVRTGKRAWTLSLIVKQLFIFIIITVIMIVIIIIIIYNKPVRPDKAALVRFSKLQTSPLAQCTSPVLAQHNSSLIAGREHFYFHGWWFLLFHGIRNDLWCLWWVDFPVLLISKCCYQIYGVLIYISNISGLTALARYHSGALF